MGRKYYNNKKISLDEAEKILNIIRDKYNIEKQQKMQEMELLKIKKCLKSYHLMEHIFGVKLI